MFKPAIYVFLLLIISAYEKVGFAQPYCVDNRFDAYRFDLLQIETIPNIIYGTATNYYDEPQALALDIYRPQPAADDLIKKPLVIFIHGGGLKGGSKASEGVINIGVDMAQRGFVCAGIDYRIGWNDIENCEGDTMSLQLALYRALQDTRASIRYLIEHADEYSIDTNYIFLSGNSVGSTLAIYAAYAEQSNFSTYQYEQLGSIDSSGNTLYNHNISVKGLFIKAAGVEKIEVLNNNSIPLLFFHGTCDTIVPYDENPLYTCFTPVQFMNYHGSWSMSRYLQGQNKIYQLYTNEGYGHDAVDNDTLFLYSGKFVKDILCNEITSKEFYSFNNGGCIAGRIKFLNIQNLYPNPFSNALHVNITAPISGNITFDFFNASGEKVFSTEQYFAAPKAEYFLQLENILLPHGIYFLKVAGKDLFDVAKIVK